ncbi:UFD1-domain-containing protein [Violaceomyces palustris]|uniref:UFD1-domain-containing protein n=1 Tax=Violaceomyces palustris TaxID=1673888 RepID=A0ACD0P324_9BASI|nr:UFD1-domain-containing protein [Violaceomyces palustris]
MSMFGSLDGPQGFGRGFNPFGHLMGERGFAPPPRAYDEFFKAYSMAMLPGRERLNVSYGGKIIMPPSALAHLTNLEIESPWLFELRSTKASEPKRTHAGVLEFIADEGNVHLPAWMMRTLGLSEGDPIRLTGASLPKGKMVKIQPQTVDFLEISDPKAVLEQALRNFSTLTVGDIIEISYNCLTFEILIMEITPDAEGIAIIETDLEVDFAPPKGYVEPTPQPRPPPPTMASKLNIDSNKVESIPPTRVSTPGSSGLGGGGAQSGANGNLAGPFRGGGQTLSGKKTKGKKDKPIEQLDPFSMVRRTDKPRIVTSETQMEEKKIPAALNLPFGKLFFGYDVIPVGGTEEVVEKEEAEAKAEGKEESKISFSGDGQTLSGRAPRVRPAAKKQDQGPGNQGGSEGQGGNGRTLGGRALGGGGSSSSTSRSSTSSAQRSNGGSGSGSKALDKEIIEIDSD